MPTRSGTWGLLTRLLFGAPLLFLGWAVACYGMALACRCLCQEASHGLQWQQGSAKPVSVHPPPTRHKGPAGVSVSQGPVPKPYAYVSCFRGRRWREGEGEGGHAGGVLRGWGGAKAKGKQGRPTKEGKEGGRPRDGGPAQSIILSDPNFFLNSSTHPR